MDKILDELNGRFPKGLVEELILLPESLKAEENKLLAYKFKLTEQLKSLNLWELKESSAINQELTADGKKLLSNESARDTELSLRKRNSTDIQKLENEILSTTTQEKVLVIEVQYLERRLKSCIAIANLVAGRT